MTGGFHIDDVIYGYAFRNHRYEKGEYNLHFYVSQSVREAMMQADIEKGDCEVRAFEITMKELLESRVGS